MFKTVRSSLSVSLLLLLLPAAALVANAQGPSPDLSIPEALRRQETSSPRQTLTRFLANTREGIEDYQDLPLSEDGWWAFRRAANALDYSTTPHSGAWNTRARTFLLLREILDRIPLPPAEEIPGDREVAEGGIEQWAIPGTRLEIARIASGPREGEFLFTAESVERLESYYRMLSHLPGKPGSLAGFYEVFLASPDAGPNRQRQIRNRLKGVDLSSPRSVFDGFLDSVNRAHRLVMDAEAAMKADPPRMTREEAAEVEIVAGNLLRRAVATLDLRKVPEANREDVGLETVLQLKEIFDRMTLPPLEAIPDASVVQDAHEGEGPSPLRPGEPFRWNYPNTEFEIIESMEGDTQGNFYFSDQTVELVPAAYEAVRDLPYRPEVPGAVILEYLSPEKSEGFYEYYASSPGYLIPGVSLLSGLVARLPEWTHKGYADQTIWQWAALVLGLLTVVLGGVVTFLGIARLARRLREPYNHWLRVLAPVIVAVLVVQVVSFLDEDINITGYVLGSVAIGGGFVVTLMFAAVALGTCRATAETIIISPRIPEEGINASLLRIGARIIGFLIGIFIVVKGVQELGVDPIPLVAGLGVGGLAVALAAQKTVANFIGSLILFANKPVRVGDFCAYGDGKVGTVEEINILSTRIRTLERSVVTIPNADFCELEIDNYSLRYERRLKTALQLRYETTPEQLRYVLAELRRLLLSHPMVNPDPARVRFIEYGDYSLNVEVYTYIRTDDHNTFLAIQEDLLLRMADIVKEAGTGFAFPSQTTYLERDTGIDEQQGRRAEERVQEWRAKGELPFPEFGEGQRLQMKNTLDYPPQGSPPPEPEESSALSEPEDK